MQQYDAKLEAIKAQFENLRWLRRMERVLWVAAAIATLAAILSIANLVLKYVV